MKSRRLQPEVNGRSSVTGVVDLRSDTVTRPTEAMRAAMAAAEVGDDVYGEDPTVARLEAVAAERLGKEAGLYVSSGRMANLVAVMSHTSPGDAVIVEALSHINLVEGGAMAALAGVFLRPVVAERGLLSAAELETAMGQSTLHRAHARLLCLENTHNFAGGIVMTAAQTGAVCALARERGMRVHLDGARVFNAAVALETEARALAREADSAMFSLTKGLSAPVGSVLVGGRDFIDRARRMRALVGGAMRQAGVIAAAGLVALDTMVDRLVEDHRHARLLAEGLRGVAGLRLDLDAVRTNIVMVEVADGQTVHKDLAAGGVLCNTVSPHQIRFVTHRHIQTADVDRVLDAARGLHLAAVGR